MKEQSGGARLKWLVAAIAVVNAAAVLFAWVLAIQIGSRKTNSTQDLAAEAQGLFAAAGLTISSALAWITGFYAFVTNRIAAASKAQADAAADQVRALEAQLDEAASAREAIERPFVVVDLDGERLHGFVFVEVCNQGRTMARDVRFKFNPPLASTFDDTGYGVTTMKMFTQGIPMLTPGRRISALFDSAPHREQAKLPDVYTAEVSYTGEPDGNGVARQYEDTIVLDLAVLKNRLSVGQQGLHEIGKHLEELAKTVSGWERSNSHGVAVRVVRDE